MHGHPSGDGLTEVTVVVNDLVDGEPELEQCLAVRDRAEAHFRHKVAALAVRAGTQYVRFQKVGSG